MPQEFQVLQCFNCQFFQVHIIKKVAKWSCKMCGEKQSIIKIFLKGTGKDCKLHVQELNEMRMNRLDQIHKVIRTTAIVPVSKKIANQTQIVPSNSKWSEYLTENSEDSTRSDQKIENSLERRVLKSHNENYDTLNHTNKKMRLSKWDEFEETIGREDIKDSCNKDERSTNSMFEPECADLDLLLRF